MKCKKCGSKMILEEELIENPPILVKDNKANPTEKAMRKIWKCKKCASKEKF